MPQLRDAEELFADLADLPGEVVLSALVGNARGVRRASDAGVREVVVVVSASDAHNRVNLNLPTRESLQGLEEICGLAREKGISVRGAVATAFGCPYQGEINEDQVRVVVEGLLGSGIKEITLADTAGLANPRQVWGLSRGLAEKYPQTNWALHFHDARGLGLTNALAGLLAGVVTLESSAGGLGGCPFIPGAAGNIATEDLVYMLESMGIQTGIELAGVSRAVEILEAGLGRPVSSRAWCRARPGNPPN